PARSPSALRTAMVPQPPAQISRWSPGRARRINAIRSIAVLGAGSWGTALAIQLCRAGLKTALWGRDRAALERLGAERRNMRYLPETSLPDALEVTPNLDAAV